MEAKTGSNELNTLTKVADDEIDLFELWAGLLEEKWVVFFSTLTVLIIAATYAFTAKPVFQASAVLQVQQIIQTSETATVNNVSEMHNLFSSIESESTTAELLNSIAPAQIETSKKVKGILYISSTGSDKLIIKKSVLDTINLIKNRHQSIFEALQVNHVKEVLPTALIGNVVVTDEPVKPKKSLILAVAAVLGLMLGVFIALIRQAVKKRKIKA